MGKAGLRVVAGQVDLRGRNEPFGLCSHGFATLSKRHGRVVDSTEVDQRVDAEKGIAGLGVIQEHLCRFRLAAEPKEEADALVDQPGLARKFDPRTIDYRQRRGLAVTRLCQPGAGNHAARFRLARVAGAVDQPLRRIKAPGVDEHPEQREQEGVVAKLFGQVLCKGQCLGQAHVVAQRAELQLVELGVRGPFPERGFEQGQRRAGVAIEQEHVDLSRNSRRGFRHLIFFRRHRGSSACRRWAGAGEVGAGREAKAVCPSPVRCQKRFWVPGNCGSLDAGRRS